MTDPVINRVRRALADQDNGGIQAGMPKVRIYAADAQNLCDVNEKLRARVAELEDQLDQDRAGALAKRIAYEEEAKKKQCAVIGCNNRATHTWSGHPTCDDCAIPGRKRPQPPREQGGEQ